MLKRFIRGGTKTLKDEHGSILVLTAALVLLLTLCFAGLSEIGRFLIVREQTQTATDAASLAASGSGVKRWVRLTVKTYDRSRIDPCGCEECDDDGCWCVPCCVSCPDVTRTAVGTEQDLIEQEGWRDYCESCGSGCGESCDYTLDDRWVEYNQNTSAASAAEFYQANLPRNSTGSKIAKVTIHSDRHDPAYPSVVVYAKSKIKSLFPGFANAFPESYETTTCSQGDTYYKKANDPHDRWIKPPEDACWKDW